MSYGTAATCELPVTYSAISNRLQRGFLVECQVGVADPPDWRRVDAVRLIATSKYPTTCWVREFGGGDVWRLPAAARYGVREFGG